MRFAHVEHVWMRRETMPIKSRFRTSWLGDELIPTRRAQWTANESSSICDASQ